MSSVGRGVAKVVGIEGGANGEGQNLAGVHVLHHDGAVERLGLLHGVVERVLGQELDVFVDGEDEIAAGLGLVLARAENLAARIHGGVHLAGNAVQLRVEFLLRGRRGRCRPRPRSRAPARRSDCRDKSAGTPSGSRCPSC